MRWATSILRGVGFDEGVHAERFGEFEELAEGLIVDRHNQQNQVGAVCAYPQIWYSSTVRSPYAAQGMFTAARLRRGRRGAVEGGAVR